MLNATFVFPEGSQTILLLPVFFEKNRGLYGDEVKPFEARLESHLSEDGVKTCNWTWKLLEDSNYEKVCRLSCDGLSNTDITQELGINKSTVSRHVKRGKQEGKINLRNN